MHYSTMTFTERRAVREQLAEQQDGKCHYCGEPLSESPAKHVMQKQINWRLFPANFLRHPVHLHHNHVTDRVIGAVHARCNAVLWQYHGE
jgi:hypothetical protein